MWTLPFYYSLSNYQQALKQHKNSLTVIEIILRSVCCPSCFSMYPWKYDSCQQLCTYIEFSNHPQHWNQKTCGMQLMKPIKTPQQASLFYPRLVYCYKPVLQTLQDFFYYVQTFSQNVNSGEREARLMENTMMYDGNI